MRELATLFLKLGLIAFGGPAAHIAMMEDEVVRRRGWMSRQHFLDLVGATNLIPGPNSTEMAMHCGHERAGVPGLFVAGAAFILPAALLTGALAWLYTRYGAVPEVEPFLYGIKPAVLAIILQAIYTLGKKALKSWQLGLIGAATLAASFLGLSEVLAILGAGLAGLLLAATRQGTGSAAGLIPPLLLQAAPALSASLTNGKLFLVFFKIGAVLFGSGYVLVAYLEDELINQRGWLTQAQLLDAIAIGQFTPGPVLSTATFIGFQLNGAGGAAAATLGIFLPSFLFVWLLNPLVPRLRKSPLAAAFLDAVNIGAVAVMIAVTIRLGAEVLVDWRSWTIALLSAAVALRWKGVSSLWIVLGGAAVGYGLHLAGG